MPLIDQDSVKSFMGEKNFTADYWDAPGNASAVTQAENIIYQKSLIPIPGDIKNAIPTLQFCAHAVYIQIISFKQKLDKEEIARRKDLFNTAMNMLEEINSGKLPLLDSTGNIINNNNPASSSYSVDNCLRSERL